MCKGNILSNIDESKNLLGNIRSRIITCGKCARLVKYREHIGDIKTSRYQNWNYWAKPVPGFGDPNAQVMIVGLAPAAHGGNRTGRVFTGDLSAKFLVAAMYEAGFTNQPTSEYVDDGLSLEGAYMSTAIRCVPPQDKPISHEQHNCRPYLLEEIQALKELKVILALGRIAFDASLRALGSASGRKLKAAFSHGCVSDIDGCPYILCASYHPSPRNTNTGRLSKDSLVKLLVDVHNMTSM